VTGALRGDGRAARRLTALYEAAPHAPDERMRTEALEALSALRAEAAT
jgi:hypothetical protein